MRLTSYYFILDKNLSIKFNNKKGIIHLDVSLRIYYALFYSHLSYGCGVWGLSTKSNIDINNKLQK